MNVIPYMDIDRGNNLRGSKGAARGKAKEKGDEGGDMALYCG